MVDIFLQQWRQAQHPLVRCRVYLLHNLCDIHQCRGSKLRRIHQDCLPQYHIPIHSSRQMSHLQLAHIRHTYYQAWQYFLLSIQKPLCHTDNKSQSILFQNLVIYNIHQLDDSMEFSTKSPGH
jgi:hypothetical protein